MKEENRLLSLQFLFARLRNALIGRGALVGTSSVASL